MSGELVPKLRVVRCPKCRLLLQEPPGCDLYKCGECGTTLQAKKRASLVANSESKIQETDAATGNALDHISEGEKCNDRKHVVPSRGDSLKEKATSTGEFHVDGNDGRGQNEDGKCNGDQLVPIVLSDEEHETESDIYNLSHRRNRMSIKGCSISNEIIHSEIKEINDGNLVEESKEESVCALDEDENNDRSGVTSEKKTTEGDLGVEGLNNENLSLEGEKEFISDSDGEDVNKDKSALAGATPEVEITEDGSKEAEDLNGGNLLPERAGEELSSALKGEDANNDKSTPFGKNQEFEITESNIAEELNDGKLSSEEAEHVPDEEDTKNDQEALEGAKPEVNTTERASTTERPSREKGNILHVSPDKLVDGTPTNPVSSNTQQKQAHEIFHHSFDRVRSVDTTDTTELIDPSSELSGVLGKLSKSPTKRSSYTYDGSFSSYDGVDERIPIQYSHSFDNTSITADGVSEGRTRKGKGLDTQHQSHLPNAKHHGTKDSKGNQQKVVETIRNDHRHWMRTKRVEFPPKVPFHRSGSHSYYERGSSSNQIHDELYRSSSFLSHESSEDTDQEEIKLLSMIRNLQDRLNRTRYMSGEANGRQSKGVSYNVNHVSSYHSRAFHDGRRFSHGLDYPLCNGRCVHGVNWRQRHNKFSRIPYSAQVTSNVHHADHSCYHCSQERHFSADISPYVLFPHQELHRSCLGQDCCSFSPHSYPSSPQMFKPSKLPPIFGRETKSDDLRHRAPELRKYLWEKMNLAAKRHHKPVAGGAPFVTCHKCFNLLQLPADFLLFKRARHQLKCGECSAVLKFSVHGSHIVSFSSDNVLCPPSSELNDQSEVIKNSNLPSVSHANYYHYSPAEAISYYDYGFSISKSYSSDGEPVSLAHPHYLHCNEYDNPSVSGDIFEPSTEKENIVPRYYSARKGQVQTDESAIHSSNVSGSRKLALEMKARPAPKSSSLHLLMGYSSPSQIIRGTRPYVEDN